MTESKAPRKSIRELDADVAATLIASATDIALIVDGEGIIRDLAFHNEDLSRELAGYENWLGQPWAHTVTIETRPKVEALLRDAASKAPPRWRQVNHPSPHGPGVPILYSAVQTGEGGRIVAVGRDLRGIAALQQRLVEAQQSMERDYSHLRHVETRYRVLFQTSSDSVVIVDAATYKVVEANPAAIEIFGGAARQPVGRLLTDGFDAPGAETLRALFARVRSAGRTDDVRARLAGSQQDVFVSASLFRQDNSSLFLVRISPVHADAKTTVALTTKSRLLQFVENAPDAIVVTGPDGRILAANPAFLELAQLASEERARSESLDRWLGRPGVDLSVLIAGLRQRGSVRLFATTLRGEQGATAQVEISAVPVVTDGQQCFGFAIRNVGRRLLADPRASRELPRSAEQLTELVGRVSMKELVRDTTDVIERLFIEAALKLTNENRASAAELLGLSRQSLYVKLRRYGLADSSGENETQQ